MMKSNFTTGRVEANLCLIMVPCRPFLLPVTTLCGLVACVALAADAPSDPLSKLRSEWRTQVEKDTKLLRERYAQNLQKLEKEMAAGGDYAGAAKARAERRKVVACADVPETAPKVPSAVPDGEPVILEAANAIVSGTVAYNAANGVLSGLRTAGAVVSWLLPPGLKAGGYEVELTYSCPPEGGGELMLKEDRYTLNRVLKGTSSWDLYQTEVIGTLRLIANSRLLELSAVAVKGTELLHLKSIRLLPAADRK
jgi:hypothetical protein